MKFDGLIDCNKFSLIRICDYIDTISPLTGFK